MQVARRNKRSQPTNIDLTLKSKKENTAFKTVCEDSAKRKTSELGIKGWLIVGYSIKNRAWSTLGLDYHQANKLRSQ